MQEILKSALEPREFLCRTCTALGDPQQPECGVGGGGAAGQVPEIVYQAHLFLLGSKTFKWGFQMLRAFWGGVRMDYNPKP